MFPRFPHDRSNPPVRGPSSHAPRPTRRYKVYLLRAADKDLTFVVRVVQELTRFGTAEAEFRMWEAHHRGRSVVLVTHLERAELYAEMFADRGLPTAIEPV